jgi:hypothetical protein
MISTIADTATTTAASEGRRFADRETIGEAIAESLELVI